MSKNPCIGCLVVAKFFKNERIVVRLNDKVYYPTTGERRLYTVILKEGKYLTLKDCETDAVTEGIKIFDVDPKNRNTLLTRSLGKVGVISSKYDGQLPKAGELWLCVIVKEVHDGRNSGCFILRPVKRLSTEPDRLIPGMYTDELINGILYIRPSKLKDRDGDDIYWILPLKHRKGLEDNMRKNNCEFYAVIVTLGKEEVEESE